MSKIVSLRGTSGSGKSTVVYDAFKRWGHAVVQANERGKPIVNLVHAPVPFYVFGPYRTPCGGCDALPSYARLIPVLLPLYARKGNILFEGLLLSDNYGAVGKALEAMKPKHDVVFAFLDTPLEMCLERVNMRRRARGEERPVNPTNTTKRFYTIQRVWRIAEGKGHVCIPIAHQRAFKDVMALLGNPVK
jgi:hypothetical protein